MHNGQCYETEAKSKKTSNNLLPINNKDNYSTLYLTTEI